MCWPTIIRRRFDRQPCYLVSPLANDIFHQLITTFQQVAQLKPLGIGQNTFAGVIKSFFIRYLRTLTASSVSRCLHTQQQSNTGSDTSQEGNKKKRPLYDTTGGNSNLALYKMALRSRERNVNCCKDCISKGREQKASMIHSGADAGECL